MSEFEATVEIEWDDEQPVPFVEVLYHVDLNRVGDTTGKTLFPGHHDTVIIGRTWPDFGDAPLNDPCMSRSQVGVSWLPKREMFKIEPYPGAALRTWYCSVTDEFKDIPLAGMDVKPGSLIAIDDRLLLRVDFRTPSHPDEVFWGGSPAVERLRAGMARQVVASGSTWIEGGPGSGKKSVCRELHSRSSRRDGPFTILRCEELVDDKKWKRLLYGDEENLGLFRECSGGVLVLHRMEYLTKAMQESIAEAVSGSLIKPVGVRQKQETDVWCYGTIGRASLMDLPPAPELARAFGLGVVSVPDVADYRGDIPTLFCRYLKRTSVRMPGVERFWVEAGADSGIIPMSFILKLLGAKWSGNVRQVQRLVVAVAKANRDQEGAFIEPEWPSDAEVEEDPFITMNREIVTEKRLRTILYEHDYVMLRVSAELGMDEPELLAKMLDFGINHPSEISLEVLREAKEKYGDSVEEMAEGLQVPVVALLNRITELGIQF